MEKNSRRNFVKNVLAAGAATVPASAFARGKDSSTTDGAAGKNVFYDVLDFGAVGDGKKVCTAAIQKTVDACATAGGGKVVVPAGSYITGPIFLKSNIEFEIFAGARLLFTNDFNSIPLIRAGIEDSHSYAGLLNGLDVANVSITGCGILDGQGEMWWNLFSARAKREKHGNHVPEPADAPLKHGRPHLIRFRNCKNIAIRGVTVLNSPSWNIHPVLCENVWIDGVTISAPADSPNTDGIDPESCKNVHISNCNIGTGDDGVIIKSGSHYREDGVPCENITVTNCVFGVGHAAVGIGSETSGGVRNVAISNCVVDGNDRGLRIKTARGRGNVVEDVRVSNIVMQNVGEAISVTMFYNGGDRQKPEPVSKTTPAFRNLHFSDIVARQVKHAAVVEGLPEMPIQGLSISNFVVAAAVTGINCINVDRLVFDGIELNAKQSPVLNAQNVRDLELYRLSTHDPEGTDPVVRFENVKNAVVQSCSAPERTATFLQLKGSGNEEISLFTNRLTHATRDVDFVDGASERAIVKGTHS